MTCWMQSRVFELANVLTAKSCQFRRLLACTVVSRGICRLRRELDHFPPLIWRVQRLTVDCTPSPCWLRS